MLLYLKNKTNLNTFSLNEEDLMSSFKSTNKPKTSETNEDITLNAFKLIKPHNLDEKEPGEIVTNKNELNETLKDDSIIENKDETKLDQDVAVSSAAITSTPYITKQPGQKLTKVDRIMQETMNKYASPTTSSVSIPSALTVNPISIKNLSRNAGVSGGSGLGIKLKIKDSSIVEDSNSSNNVKMMETDLKANEKPVENFNLVIKKNSDSSSSVIIKQSTPGTSINPNKNTLIKQPQPHQQQQQAIPKLKISNTAGKNPSFKPNPSHSVFNSFLSNDLNKSNKLVHPLNIKPIIVNSDEDEKQSNKEFSFTEKHNPYDDDDDVIPAISASSSMKLNFDDDENAMDGVESKKYFSNNNSHNEPLIWKPVFNDTSSSNDNKPTVNIAAPPPPLVPFSIKSKINTDSTKFEKPVNKISIVDYYSSNSNESNSNSQTNVSTSVNNVKVETGIKSSIKPNNEELKPSKEYDNSIINPESTEASKEKHKKKKKNKDKEKDKDKEKKHHYHGDRKDKSSVDDYLPSSSPSSTASSSTKKKDKKERKELKELKRQQKKLEKAQMMNADNVSNERTAPPSPCPTVTSVEDDETKKIPTKQISNASNDSMSKTEQPAVQKTQQSQLSLKISKGNLVKSNSFVSFMNI
jgi:hypothetical protein